jgi:hypothetical protein
VAESRVNAKKNRYEMLQHGNIRTRSFSTYTYHESASKAGNSRKNSGEVEAALSKHNSRAGIGRIGDSVGIALGGAERVVVGSG